MKSFLLLPLMLMLGISTVEEPIIKVEKPPQSTPAIVYTVEQPRQPIARERAAKPIVESTKQYAQRRVNEVFGQGQWGSFNNIVGRESSWRNTAQNPTSTAYGLCQFLNSTWKGTGYTKTSDPKIQIEACLVYVKNRYGNPNNTWIIWQKNKWF